MTSDLEDDDIEEGVYQISLLPPLDSHQLEAMFEVLSDRSAISPLRASFV